MGVRQSLRLVLNLDSMCYCLRYITQLYTSWKYSIMQFTNSYLNETQIKQAELELALLLKLDFQLEEMTRGVPLILTHEAEC